MDLCILFSPTSHTLLGEMVTNIFTYQPKFHHDLEMAVNGLSQVVCFFRFGLSGITFWIVLGLWLDTWATWSRWQTSHRLGHQWCLVYWRTKGCHRIHFWHNCHHLELSGCISGCIGHLQQIKDTDQVVVFSTSCMWIKSVQMCPFNYRLVEFYEKAYTYLCQELDCINVSEALKFKDTIMISRRYFLSIYNSLLQSVSIRPLLSNK